MLIEWLRRRDAKLDEHLRTYLFRRARSWSSSTRPSTAATPRPAAISASARSGGWRREPPAPRPRARSAPTRGRAIETEVRRALTTFLTARRLVDFSGPPRLRDVVARPRPYRRPPTTSRRSR